MIYGSREAFAFEILAILAVLACPRGELAQPKERFWQFSLVFLCALYG